MLSEYLKHLLKKEQRTKAWLSRKCGFTPDTAGRLTKTENWRKDKIESVAKAFDLSAETFMRRAKKHCKGE
jgi:hypothetical protein